MTNPEAKPRDIQNSQPSSEHEANGLPGLSTAAPRESQRGISIPKSAGSAAWASQRQPARSFVQRSFYGPADPPESLKYSNQGVRRQTAELASFVLSDTESVRSRHSSASSASFKLPESAIAEDYSEDESTPRGDQSPSEVSFRQSSSLTEAEASRPVRSSASTSTSALTTLLRRTPPNGPAEHSSGKMGRHEHVVRRSSGESIQSTEEDESTALLQKTPSRQDYGAGDGGNDNIDVERQLSPPQAWHVRLLERWRVAKITSPKSLLRKHTNHKPITRRDLLDAAVIHPLACIPSVILGVLLNILDALSYGLILFPLGSQLFANTSIDGLSMFYVSTIIAQLTFTLGGSKFKGGVGSEMIEVVPFFHTMAFTILGEVGPDNPKSVLATTILSYSISSVLTGAVFGILGAAKLGNLVAFFPRHILTGCIGGVGWFLIATGVEVSARLDGNLDYNLKTLRKLFEADTVALWLLPLGLAIICKLVEPWIPERLSKYWMPFFFLLIPAIFYAVVTIHPDLDIQQLQDLGWIFQSPPTDMPWYHFYTLYDFHATDWAALARTIPAMLALTFFGILHVPINIPALALTTGEADIDLNHELIGHGVSNALSGAAGSIQNYLVYTNSVVFMKTGGHSRTAGFLLACATAGILLAGPTLIGFIPICMVGALIFYLGLELFVEGVYGPYKKVLWFEYLTILIIVATMGLYDFVTGIFVGILLACLSFVTRSARTSAIRASYDGTVARSTVRRPIAQRRYLDQVGRQIHVTKLAGFIFFGTIVDVERQTRALLDEDRFSEKPIRFVIFDCVSVDGIDYSASEGLGRLQSMFASRSAHLILAGVNPFDGLGGQLRELHLWDKVKTYPNLNEALEACENELLMTLHRKTELLRKEREKTKRLEIPRTQHDGKGRKKSVAISGSFVGSPRADILAAAAANLSQHALPPQTQKNYPQPLPLILQVFQDLTSLSEEQWSDALPYFRREEFKQGETLFRRHEMANGFYLVESGILRAEDHALPGGGYHEIMQQGTSCGELPFFSETERTMTVTADEDAVVWVLGREEWERMKKEKEGLSMELIRLAMKLTRERVDVVTRYTLVTGG